jgi:iron complex transport system substrate-binding protein
MLCLFAALILSGCSTGNSNEPSPASVTTNEEAASPQQIGEKTDESSSDRVRTVTDVTGSVDVPAQPRKIAVLLDYYADHLLELGIKPYASTTSLVDNQFLPYLGTKMDGVIPLGQSESPNLEALLEAEPDLIIAYAPSHQEIAGSLRKIAPTVLLDGKLMDDWRTLFLELGNIVGEEQLAQQKLAAYLSKAEAAKKELAQRAGDDVFAVIRVMPKELRVYGTDDIRIGRIIHQELGLHGLQLADNKAMMPISLEELPRLNPDHIFLMENVEDVAKDKLEELKSSAIWRNVSAVKQNQVYIVEQQLWNRGIAPIGSSQIIDQVLELVK